MNYYYLFLNALMEDKDLLKLIGGGFLVKKADQRFDKIERELSSITKEIKNILKDLKDNKTLLKEIKQKLR